MTVLIVEMTKAQREHANEHICLQGSYLVVRNITSAQLCFPATHSGMAEHRTELTASEVTMFLYLLLNDEPDWRPRVFLS